MIIIDNSLNCKVWKYVFRARYRASSYRNWYILVVNNETSKLLCGQSVNLVWNTNNHYMFNKIMTIFLKYTLYIQISRQLYDLVNFCLLNNTVNGFMLWVFIILVLHLTSLFQNSISSIAKMLSCGKQWLSLNLCHQTCWIHISTVNVYLHTVGLFYIEFIVQVYWNRFSFF